MLLASEAAATTGDAAALDDSVNSEDIVVTANKRSENVQSVGTAVSVISGERLAEQKLERLSDYVATLPGVTANSTGTPGQSSLTIRGISPLSAGSKVATYIDETPLGSSGIWAQAGGLTLDLLPFDLDRLELLRGPQGTLYGASSMGGLLKYVLKAPDANVLGVGVSADIAAIKGADRPAGTVSGRINVPVIEGSLAVSGSGFYKNTPGYIDNIYTDREDTNGVEQYGGRVAAFWQPAPNFTVKLNALWQRTKSKDNSVESLANPAVMRGAGRPLVIRGGTPYGPRTQSNAFAAEFESKVNFYSGTVNWDLGAVELVSATSWSEYDIRRLANRSLNNGTLLPAFGLPEGLVLGGTRLGTDKLTQEVRLTSPTGSFLAWQVGGFYTREKQTNIQTQDAFSKAYVPVPQLQPNASFITIPTVYREYAIFGDVTLTLTSEFDVSGGIRYSDNRQVFDISARGALAGLPQTPITTLNTIRSSEDNVTWSAGARYRFTPDIMAYVRVATGYAPGGANTPYPGVPQATVDSETLTSYEVGLKSQFLDRRILVNLSAFRIDWKDIQLAARFGPIGYSANGGSARSQGLEFTTSFEPADGLKFGLNAAYTDAELTSLNPAVTTAFIVGQKLQQVPALALSGTVDYDVMLDGGWEARFGGAIRWVDDQLGAQPAVGAPLFTLPAYTVADLTATVTNGRYSFGLYVKNVGNSRAISGGYPYIDRTGGVRQIDYFISQPRTLGLSATARF